jgi:putative acyl-CoA dehydrogenase
LASEVIESFGGAGYVEDTGIPRLLRDAQVLSIWEGTTNVLSLDTLRAMDRVDAFGAWTADVRRRLGAARPADMNPSAERVAGAVQRIEDYALRASRSGKEFQQTGARAFSYAIARTEAATLLIEHAQAAGDRAAIVAAQRWCARDLAPLIDGDELHRVDSAHLADSDHQR